MKWVVWAIVGVGAVLVLYFFLATDGGRDVTRARVAEASQVSGTAPVAKRAVGSVASMPTVSPQSSEMPAMSPESVRFRAARKCAFALSALEGMQNMLRTCEESKSYPRNADNEEFFKSCEARTVQFAREMPLAQDVIGGCPTVDRQEANEKFFEDTTQAALKGDTDAQMCYLRAAQFDLARPWTEGETEDYQQAAPLMVQAGLERGDWRTIELLSKATPDRPGRLVPMLHHAVPFDVTNPYRMNRLLRSGAVSKDYIRFLDVMARHHAQGLTSEQKLASDLWAGETYHRYYAHSPKLEQAPPNCMREPIGYAPTSD